MSQVQDFNNTGAVITTPKIPYVVTDILDEDKTEKKLLCPYIKGTVEYDEFWDSKLLESIDDLS